MSLRTDQRGQAIQVGAVLLFAILVIGFSTYQAVIIPEDNRRVEFNHNQEVQEHLTELRSAVVGTAESTSVRSVIVALGTTYPSRTLGLNPGPPGGSLRTVGTTDPMVNLTIDNAVASGETGDFWNGSARAYNTGAIQYSPDYHRYSEAPETIYEHSILYNHFRSSNTFVLANQTLLDSNRLSIVAVNGSVKRSSSRSTTIDVRPASSGGDPLSIRSADDDPIILRFSSRLTVDDWRQRLGHTGNVTVSEGDFSPPDGLNPVRVELERSSYRLQLAKAAVGQGATTEAAAYLTDRSGDGAPVPLDSSRELTLQVRDRYNNPVGGESVNASLGGGAPGTLSAVESTSEANGDVTFTYEVGEDAATGTYPVNFTLEGESSLTGSFNRSTPANVTMEVTVGGASGSNASSGAYSVEWTNPNNENANDNETLVSCDLDACTWDVGDGGDGDLLLNARLEPAFEDVDLTFAVNNSAVAGVSPRSGTTESDGAAMTNLQANDNGTVGVLVSGNDVSDLITVEVTNVTDLEPSAADQVQFVSGSAEQANQNGEVDFELENTGTSAVTIQNVEVTSTEANDAERVFENQNGDVLEQREFGFDGSDHGYYEAGDQWNGDGVPIGTTVSLSDSASMDGGTTMTVHMRSFVANENWDRVDMTGEEIVVKIGYADGSIGTYTLTPQ